MSHEFQLLFKPVIDQLDSVEFRVLDSTIYNIDRERKAFSLSIRGKGSKNWSSCQKIIIVSNTGQVIFESPLTQIDGSDFEPECGVPDYSLDTIFHAAVRDREYLMTQVRQYFYGCVGQPLTDRKILYVNSTDNFRQIDTLVTFQRTISEGTEQLRRAEFVADKDGPVIRVREHTGDLIKYTIFEEGLRAQK